MSPQDLAVKTRNLSADLFNGPPCNERPRCLQREEKRELTLAEQRKCWTKRPFDAYVPENMCLPCRAYWHAAMAADAIEKWNAVQTRCEARKTESPPAKPTQYSYYAAAVTLANGTRDAVLDADSTVLLSQVGDLLNKYGKAKHLLRRLTLGVVNGETQPQAKEAAELDMWWSIVIDIAPDVETVKLREAVAAAGFAVLQTSGKWSIHDVSEKAKAAAAVDDAKTLAVINENIAATRQLRDARTQANAILYTVDNTHHDPFAKALQPEIARLVAMLQEGPSDGEG